MDPGRDRAAAVGPAGESLRLASSGPDVVPRRPGQHAASPARTEPASARREPPHVEAPGAEAPDASRPLGRDASGIPAPAERAAAPTRVSVLPPEGASATPPEPGPAPPTVHIGVVEVRVAVPAPAPAPVTGAPAAVAVPPAASRLSRPAVPFGLAQG